MLAVAVLAVQASKADEFELHPVRVIGKGSRDRTFGMVAIFVIFGAATTIPRQTSFLDTAGKNPQTPFVLHGIQVWRWLVVGSSGSKPSHMAAIQEQDQVALEAVLSPIGGISDRWELVGRTADGHRRGLIGISELVPVSTRLPDYDTDDEGPVCEPPAVKRPRVTTTIRIEKSIMTTNQRVKRWEYGK